MPQHPALPSVPTPEDSELIGRTLANYRITAAIGAGGMGEVYEEKEFA